MNKKLRIAVDFDGTLCDLAFPKIVFEHKLHLKVYAPELSQDIYVFILGRLAKIHQRYPFRDQITRTEDKKLTITNVYAARRINKDPH